MSEQPTIPAEYMQHVGTQLRRFAVEHDRWLTESGLATDALDDPKTRLPLEQVQALVRSALALCREPALGLFVGEQLVAGSHGIVGALAVNSQDVRQALEMVERYVQLRSSLFVITHELRATEGRVFLSTTHPLGEVERPIMEAVLLSIKSVLDDVMLGACALGEVALAAPEPEYAGLARDMFGCKVSYGQDWTGLRGDLEVFQAPLAHADPTAFEAAALICQKELARLGADETLAVQVRRLLLERQNRFPTQQVAARRLHMTSRTLHRRLSEEGTSFREILEAVRHTLALEHLKSSHFTMSEVAYRLGYTDLSNFRRAFKRWEGVSPSVYRERYVR